MSKSSVITVRETPVAKTTSASVGGFTVVAETIDVDTTERVELVDLTDTVMAFVRRSGVQEGLLSLWSMHTTCTVFINESQKALETDILAFLENVVARGKYYRTTIPIIRTAIGRTPTRTARDEARAFDHDADQRRRAGGRAMAACAVRRDGRATDSDDPRSGSGDRGLKLPVSSCQLPVAKCIAA
jgi:hypothetical protein